MLCRIRLKMLSNLIRLWLIIPGTFRQIFEGKVEWSDFMPWYYLPKSMVITIPVIVLSGCSFLFFTEIISRIRKSSSLMGFSFYDFVSAFFCGLRKIESLQLLEAVSVSLSCNCFAGSNRISVLFEMIRKKIFNMGCLLFLLYFCLFIL